MRFVKAGPAAVSGGLAHLRHGSKPHFTQSFKLARDPNFNARVTDIVGLYLDPPEKALSLQQPFKRAALVEFPFRVRSILVDVVEKNLG